MTDATRELFSHVFDQAEAAGLVAPEDRPRTAYVIVPAAGSTVDRDEDGYWQPKVGDQVDVDVIHLGPPVVTDPADPYQVTRTVRVPGSPDPALIVGDWTGEAASKTEREALAYREANRRLRGLHTSLAKLREFWATSDREGSAARAVAYQTAVSRIGAIIEDTERLVAGS